MYYQATQPEFNTDRQKWQTRVNVYGVNSNNPGIPDPVNAFQGILIDCANSSATAVRQACVAFCGAVEDLTSAEMVAIVDKIVDAETGAVVPSP